MTQEQAIQHAVKLILSGATHKNYERVVKLAADYFSFITGEDVERLIIRYVQRETVEAFNQRLQLTHITTPALTSSIMKPFYKVSRNDKVKKRFDFKDTTKNELVTGMIKGFYGAKNKKNRGLDHWFKTRFPELTFTDPNSWTVTEWATPQENQPAEPHPFEVTAAEARNFEIVNEEIKWLFVRTTISFSVIQPGAATPQEEVRTVTNGFKYTLYDQDYTIVIERMDRVTEERDGRQLGGNEAWIKIGEDDYLQSVYTPKLGYVAAFRNGYVEDTVTKGETFVAPFHVAMAFFRKSIKTVSELDLTMSQHVFPQKIQYVEACPGTKQNPCQEGFARNSGNKCEVCHGRGYVIHTSAQDAIVMTLPQDKEDMIELDKLLVYKAPPIELVKFMDEYTKGLKIEAHLAVFNSEVFVRPELTVAKTATEINDNMESVYDTLEPFTEAISEKYIDQVNTFAHLAAVSNPEECENIHQYPGDLKLKSTTVLLNELKAANESGAPSFMRDIIGNDLAEIMYVGDDLSKRKYDVKHRFFPFNGKTPDEIAMLVSSQYVSEFTKVLYSNYEAIFADIEQERPEFWLMKSVKQQWDMVKKKTQEYIDALAPEPATIDFGGAAGANQDGTQAGGGDDAAAAAAGNPGEDSNADPNTDVATS